MSDSTRRRLLLGTVATASAAVAGCAGVVGDDGAPETDDGSPTEGDDGPTTDASEGATDGGGATTEGPGGSGDDPDAVYVVAHDMVRGYLPDVDQERAVGVMTNQFLPGEAVKWRISVVDGATGEEVGPGVLGQGNVAVTLGDGTRIEATFGNQPLRADPADDRDLDRYYTATWEIPPDHPPEILDYSLDVDADRPVHTVHFETEDSMLTVLGGPAVTEPTTTSLP